MSTIFALSSGSLPSGVAIIRLSGPHALAIIAKMTGRSLKHRYAHLCSLKDDDGELLDKALVLTFPAPASFTGEDVVEIHCHGGMASVEGLLDYLSQQKGLRLAEAGEFSRRGFENGKMDLTAMEGLSDLIAAQTANQRRLALAQSSGDQRQLYDDWRNTLIRCRAMIEAEFDFSDEDDIPSHVSDRIWRDVAELQSAIEKHLSKGRHGEIIRDGFRIALIGPPNAGKSSLLNALAKRDVAIVTHHAGTTRDVLDVHLNIDGQLVILSDTAGLRVTDDEVEQEGIKRALNRAEEAHLALYLLPVDKTEVSTDIPKGATIIRSKADLLNEEVTNEAAFSTLTKDGTEPVLNIIKRALFGSVGWSEDILMSRSRHRQELNVCAEQLHLSQDGNLPLELRSECLRSAGDALGRLTGRIDVEHLLDVIFSEFCVGK